MKNDNKIIPLLAVAGLILYMVASIDAHLHGKKDIPITTQIMLMILLGGLALIMLLPDLSFFRSRKENELIIIDLDQDQHPVKIYQVQEEDLILYCMTEFDMDFRVNEWKELEAKLKERILTTKHNRLQLEQWLRQGRASLAPGATKIATLEFDSPDGFVSKILPVETVPDAITAAIIVIRNNYPNSIIFHSEQELDGWLEKLPWKQRKSIHAKIDEFRYKRERLLVNG